MMENSQPKFRDNSTPDTSESQVFVNDIVRYLSGLARLNDDEKTGNPRLSQGLWHLIKALRPYANSPISELRVALPREVDLSNVNATARRRQVTLPTDLESLDQADIERILEDGRYTKQQIAKLGSRRFGMSRSNLLHSRKDDALESVRAALDNERSLDVIYEEARKGGALRPV